MKENPITEIRDQLEMREESLKTVAEFFQIPFNVAKRVMNLPWLSFQEYTGDFIDKHVWDKQQSLMVKEGETALNGLRLGSTKIVVGDKYAILHGNF